MPSLAKEVSLGYWKLRFQVTENSTSVANNTSSVGYSATLISTGGTAQYNGAGEIHIYINGAHVLANTVNINVMTNGGSQSLGSGTTTVGHDADGSKTVSVSATYKQVGTAYYLPKGGTVSGTLKLTDIPRATDITVDISNGTTLGNTVTIKGTPHVTSFSHKIAYSLNNGDPVDIKTIDSGATNISEAWTIPTSLATSIIDSDSATLNLILYTYNGSSQIGAKQTSITVKIPESYVPSIGTISISEAVSSIASKFGKYVAEKSQLKFNISASGSNGSAITSYTTNIDKKSYTSQSFTTDVINGNLTNSDTDDITYTVTVTDSRGRTASKTGTVSVLTYHKPMFSTFSVQRANSSYEIDETSGTYALFRYTYDTSKLDNKNTVSMIIKYKAMDDTSWTTLNTVANAPYTAIFTKYHGGNIFNTTKDYEVMIGLKDYFMSDYIYAYGQVNSTYTLINWANSGKAMSLFKQSDLNLSGNETDAVKSAYENWFEVHGDSYFSEMPNVMEDSSKTSSEISAHNTKLNNANKGTPLDKYILNKVYPIGSLYLSVNNVNPGTLFGGSWVSYGEGRVLIGAGTGTDANGKQMTFTAGATGGEYSHRITIDEIPSHSHQYYSPIVQKVTAASSGSTYGNYNKQYKISTDSSGGDQAHNNMMPYIGVYIWRRVA